VRAMPSDTTEEGAFIKKLIRHFQEQMGGPVITKNKRREL